MVSIDPLLDVRAEIDRIQIELEALRRTLGALVEHFDERLQAEREKTQQEFNPEAA